MGKKKGGEEQSYQLHFLGRGYTLKVYLLEIYLGWTRAHTSMSDKSWYISYLFEFTNAQRGWLPGARKETVTHVNILRNDIKIYLIYLRGPNSAQITEKDNSIPNERMSLDCESTLIKKFCWNQDLADCETHSSWKMHGYLCDLGLRTKCVSTVKAPKTLRLLCCGVSPDWA